MGLPALSRNEVAVLDAVHRHGQATRGDVGASVGLGPAMAARVVARLLDKDLLRPAGRAVTAGPGRQALLMEINPAIASVLGLDIGTDVVHVLVADAQGTTRAYREVPSSMLAGRSREEIVAALGTLSRDVIATAGIAPEQLAAAGVSVTGIIDSDRGVCLVRSNTPGWEEFALGPTFAAEMGLPVLVEETARAKAVAEMRRGHGRAARHFLYVDAGTAIGCGIVIDGRPLRGIQGLAGELGHVVVDAGGPLCRCGNHGCLQASASAHAIVARARDLLRRGVYSALSDVGESLALADIAAAAQGGDKLALSLLTEAGERLGIAISMALNILGLHLVVVGGRLAQCSPVVLEAATRVVNLRVLPIVPLKRTITCSALGRDAAALGVALQALDRLFSVSPDETAPAGGWLHPPAAVPTASAAGG